MAGEIKWGDLVVVVLTVEEEKNEFKWGFAKGERPDDTEKKFLIETDSGDSWHSRDQLHIYARTVASSLEEALEDAEYCHPQIMLKIIAEKFQLEQRIKKLEQRNRAKDKIEALEKKAKEEKAAEQAFVGGLILPKKTE